MTAKRKTLTPKQIVAQEKRRQGLELRKAGATYAQIARAVGYSGPKAAYAALQKAMSEIIQEPVMEQRAIQKERLNHMLMILWPQVQNGDRGAMMTALSIMDKLDRYDPVEPTEHTINIHQDGAILVIDGSKDDYIAQIKKMVGINSDGTNKEITQTRTVYDVPDEDVVEAEVVPAPVQEKPAPVAKGWNWSMDEGDEG